MRSDVLCNVSAVVVCRLMSVAQFVCGSGVRSDVLYGYGCVSVPSDVLYNVSAVVVCRLMSVVQFVCGSGVRSDVLYNLSAVAVCGLMCCTTSLQ